MVGDPSPNSGELDFFQKSLGDPFPSSGGVDFFQKSLGDPWTIVGLELKKDWKLSMILKM